MTPTSLDSKRKESSSPFRFPRTHRLKRKRLIEPLFDRDEPNTRTVSVGCIRVLYRFADPSSVEKLTPLQVAFAVRKTIGGAVVRNRTKRILREAFRTNYQSILVRLSESKEVLTAMIIVRHLPRDENALRRDLIDALARLEEELGISDMANRGPETYTLNENR